MYDYTDDVIENNEKWFNFFVIAPKVITIALAVLCGLAGIVMSIAYKSAFFLIYFWVGGGIDCLITYVVLKLLFSYRILHIYYLKKIALKMSRKINVSNGENEDYNQNNVSDKTNNPSAKEQEKSDIKTSGEIPLSSFSIDGWLTKGKQ